MEKAAINEHAPLTQAPLLLNQLSAFYDFVQARVRDPETARDIVHDSLLKALKTEHQVAEEKATAWFYRVLRNAIIDHYRGAGARGRALEKVQQGFTETPSDEDERDLCRCVNALLPNLKPAYAQVLRAVDLEGGKLVDYARAAGRSENAMRVKLHRARAELRNVLEKTCGTCAVHGCLDCQCGS